MLRLLLLTCDRQHVLGANAFDHLNDLEAVLQHAHHLQPFSRTTFSALQHVLVA